MSTRTTGKGRRKTWFVATLIGAFGAFLALGAGNAFAASCAQVGAVVTINIGNETAVVSVGNLSHINVNGVWCAPATTANTDTIQVNGTGVADTLVIDLSGGNFQPGLTASPAGINEIEWLLGAAGAGPPSNAIEALVVNGNATPDVITIGDGLIYPGVDIQQDAGGASNPGIAAGDVGIVNLNNDEDADVFIDSTLAGAGPVFGAYPFISVFGNSGGDTISGDGTKGTGAAVGAANFALGFVPVNQGLFISGGPGDDNLKGGAGDDIIQTGAGNDVADGGVSNEDIVFGSFCQGAFDAAGNPGFALVNGDTIDYSASTGPVTVNLDALPGPIGTATKPDGSDTLQNIENINGSPGDDTLSGDNTQNVIMGGAGNDTIGGDGGNDCEFGQDGNDTFDQNEGVGEVGAGGGFTTDNGADFILGGGGLDDNITYSARTTPVNVYMDPVPTGFLGVIGGTQPPFPFAFEGLCGFEFIENNGVAKPQAKGFGIGFFWWVPDGADLGADGFSGHPADENDCVFEDTENAVGGSNNDRLVGNFVANAKDNEFTGNNGNDLMSGGRGNDIFHEGTAANGADDMDGGTGSDTCDWSGRTGSVNGSIDGSDNDGEAGEGDNCGGVVTVGAIAVLIDFFNETITIGPAPGEGEPSSPQNTENIDGGSGNDVLAGNDQQNVLRGNAGNDELTGLAGQDVLSGGDGDDSSNGGTGNDAIDGGAGNDWVNYSTATGGVVVNLATGTSSGADGNDTLTGNENATGSSHQDSLRGDSGNNVLNGRGADDAIQGLDGDDTVNGGAGADELGGGGGNDRINGGNGPDAIRGGGGDDNLQGGPGRDTLMGGVGDDVLSGGAAADDHRGGPGSDRCIPGSPGLGRGDTASGCES
jgi:Ca2+-binding RTX toxin-like protein